MYTGLTNKEAENLLSQYGRNEIRQINKNTPLNILLRQITSNPVIYLMIGAFIISMIVGKVTTAYVVLGVIFIVISVGFIQEYKAERSIEALKQMITSTTLVIRDNKEKEIDTKDIVPGDILILRTGERVPADCIILEEKDLKVDESLLTGESKEVKKSSKTTEKTEDSFTQENMVYMGTFIIEGKCVARVVHTGMNTKFGSIAQSISTIEKDLPLQKKINKLIKQLVALALIVSFITGIFMILNNNPLTYDKIIEILIVVLALSIAAFPEGFPVVLIAALSNGAYRMAKKNAIINRMSIIETLGETTVICSDKTGTITTGQMIVSKIFADDTTFEIPPDSQGRIYMRDKKIGLKDNKVLNMIIKTAILCNDAKIEKKDEKIIIGSSTEKSLLLMGANLGIYKEDIEHVRIDEKPFSSERKMMSVIVKEKNTKKMYTKGATDILIKKCKYILKNSGIKELTDSERRKIVKKAELMSSNSLRVIGFAYKEIKYDMQEEELIFLGIAGIRDPPRPEVKEAIELCNSAGIEVKMITGDSIETAKAIAKEIGLKGDAMTGKELDEMTDDELSKNAKKISVFARVRPDHKIKIVRALKNNGEVVAMTGDGVNDAPALKEAHIGIAMGKNGTDVSREAADMILKDDRFYTIVEAISEGRTIFMNIQKFSAYQISINIAQLFLITIAIFLNLPLPLLAIQILFMNIISDEITAISLIFNPSAKDIMSIPPRRKSEIITKPIMMFLLTSGVLMTLGAIATYYIAIQLTGLEIIEARTILFTLMTLFAVFNAFNFRSFRKLVMTRSPLTNKYLFFASIVSILLTIIAIYTPLNKVLNLTPIGLNEWILTLLTAIMFIVIMDNLKLFNNKYKIFKEV
ncbi:MAG: calcium-transporting P-type ATPase, PMR1-type [Candidatus Woesearchaeota archaeon]|nr:MAG: calcium-transporting P-type ATPase, PMR1-type [Candidatus Woesearchaeota archaeon]